MSPIDSVFGPYFGENFETRETVYTNFDHFAHPRKNNKRCNETFQQDQTVDRFYSAEHFHPGKPIKPFRQIQDCQEQPPCADNGPPPYEREQHKHHHSYNDDSLNQPCQDDYPPPYTEGSNHRYREDREVERYSKPSSKRHSSSNGITKPSPCKTLKTTCSEKHNNQHHISQTERISKDIQNNFECITNSGQFTIKKGYTLSEVSQAFSNSTNGEISSQKILNKIIEINGIDTPDCIEAGKEIRIPQSVINKMKK